MELINLQLSRVMIHEVFQRADDRAQVPPRYGTALERLDADAIDALRNRVVSAIGSPAKCIQMAIQVGAAGSMCALAESLADADDVLFVQQSRLVADSLAVAQKSRNIPGGIVIVFSGSAGGPAKRLVGVIKAEVHSGFTREEQQGALALKFLKNLLLTAQTKLYKIGLFVEITPRAVQPLPAGWDAFVYDETLTLANRYGAAQYFYEGFLGTAFPESSARQTKQFHDLTKGFIRGMNIAEPEKAVLHNALVTYLKADQAATVSVTAFGQTYLATGDLQDAYREYMSAADFPMQAVNKDLSDVNNALRIRRLVFRNQVKVTAPAEGFDNLIQIQVIEHDQDGNELTPRWTQLTVKADITGQE